MDWLGVVIDLTLSVIVVLDSLKHHFLEGLRIRELVDMNELVPTNESCSVRPARKEPAIDLEIAHLQDELRANRSL